MKEGYIVWNLTNYGDGYEFYGVFRSKEQAEAHLRKVLKARYGKLPKDEDELLEWEDNVNGCLDSHRIDYFCKNKGEN